MSTNFPILLETIAKQAYNANAIYMHANGNHLCSWDSLPITVRDVMIAAVEEYAAGNFRHAVNIHSRWYEAMKEAGWNYGETFCNDAKTHPYMLAYDELPTELRIKDALFMQSVMGSFCVADALSLCIRNAVASKFSEVQGETP